VFHGIAYPRSKTVIPIKRGGGHIDLIVEV